MFSAFIKQTEFLLHFFWLYLDYLGQRVGVIFRAVDQGKVID